MCGLTVENELICVNPQTSQLGQNVYHLQTDITVTPWPPYYHDHLVSFQIVNKNVGQPEILNELQIHRYQ